MLTVRALNPRFRSSILKFSFFSTSTSSAAAVQAERTIREGPRNDWEKDEIKSVYDSPVLDLLFHGAQVHRHAHNFREVQQCTLLSVKTGGCSEDCSYCPQSSRYDTGIKGQKMMNKDAVLQAAEKIVSSVNQSPYDINGLYPEKIVLSLYQNALNHLHGRMSMSFCLSKSDFSYIYLSQLLSSNPVRVREVDGRRYDRQEDPFQVWLAKEAGSTRFCMGAAWRDTVGRKTNFNQILEYVKEIRGMGMEVCCTLGMIEKQQAEQLKEAGLTAYNHNLDTSREYYPNIITTRSYDERLETLQFVREAGINVCSGGIIGLGEAEDDRVGLLHTLATLPTHPESVPINALVAVKGTPLENQKPVEIWEMVRMIATARIVMPKAMVRLSAGRVKFSMSEQALCFLAGANSIFTGEKLLTTPNNDFDADQMMFKLLGLTPKAPSFEEPSTALEAERCEQAVSSSC